MHGEMERVDGSRRRPAPLLLQGVHHSKLALPRQRGGVMRLEDEMEHKPSCWCEDCYRVWAMLDPREMILDGNIWDGGRGRDAGISGHTPVKGSLGEGQA